MGEGRVLSGSGAWPGRSEMPADLHAPGVRPLPRFSQGARSRGEGESGQSSRPGIAPRHPPTCRELDPHLSRSFGRCPFSLPRCGIPESGRTCPPTRLADPGRGGLAHRCLQVPGQHTCPQVTGGDRECLGCFCSVTLFLYLLACVMLCFVSITVIFEALDPNVPSLPCGCP